MATCWFPRSVNRHLEGETVLSRYKSRSSDSPSTVSSHPDVSSQKIELSPSALSLLTTPCVACSKSPRRGRMMKMETAAEDFFDEG